MTAKRCEDCGQTARPFTCGSKTCAYPYEHSLATCPDCGATRCGECYDLRDDCLYN